MHTRLRLRRLLPRSLRSVVPAATVAVVLVFSLQSTSLACASCAAAAAPATAGTLDSAGTPPPATAPQPVGHPLRGVIVDLLTEKQALLVKHEEIPGVMRAMTMMLKVDAPTLAAAKKGEAITATLVRKTDGWWLENVKAVAPAEAPAGGQG